MIKEAGRLGIASNWTPPSIAEIDWMMRNEGRGLPIPGTVGEWCREIELRELRRNSFQPYYIKNLGK